MRKLDSIGRLRRRGRIKRRQANAYKEKLTQQTYILGRRFYRNRGSGARNAL